MNKTSSCLSYCLSESFQTNDLIEYFSEKLPITRYRETFYLSYYSQEIFIFKYGVIVFWGDDKAKLQEFILEIQSFYINKLSSSLRDEFNYGVGNELEIKNDVISLKSNDVMEKLALSHAISQSLKLSEFELKAEETIVETKNIPLTLSETGSINLSARDISKMQGRLFIVKSEINLKHDLLDTPEFFWEYPEYEPIYSKMEKYLDVPARVEVLNSKLHVISEIFSMLNEAKRHQHSSRLEWIIIILIFIEIVIFLLYDVLKII